MRPLRSFAGIVFLAVSTYGPVERRATGSKSWSKSYWSAKVAPIGGDCGHGERNMGSGAMGGIVVPPGSKSTSRVKGPRRKLGNPTSDHRHYADLVRIGKVRMS